MSGKKALELLLFAWSGRKDAKNYPDFDDIHNAFYFIKQDLDKLEKLEKALKILKTKRVEISFLLCSKDLEEYEDSCTILDVYFPTLSNYEFLLLKEVLSNE